MGTTLYIALDREIPGIDPNEWDRTFLAKLVGDADEMEKLAKQLGTPSICEFQSYAGEDMADLIDEPNDETAQILAAEPQWFDPALAIPALQALQAYYAKTRFIPPRARRVKGVWEDVDRTDDLVGELKNAEDVLTVAAQNGARFRFHIGF